MGLNYITRLFIFSLFATVSSININAQTDFFGRSFTGQSPNSAELFVLFGVSSEMSWVKNVSNLSDFEHAAQQIDLFNLGIEYASQITGDENLEAIQINLDTLVGGRVQRRGLRFNTGLEYEVGEHQGFTLASFGGSRFQEGGFSVALRQEFSVLPRYGAIELIPATVREQGLQANLFMGIEAGFDSGFSVSLEQSGIKQLVTNHLVQDVAEGNITFEQFQIFERELHQSISNDSPRNTGGSEWFGLATLKGQAFITPSVRFPLRFALGFDAALDVIRLKKRKQSRFGLFLRADYLFI